MVFTLLSSNVFSSTQGEINHLLQFVGLTSCKYERNGTMHTGKDAVEHINKKYEYYKDDIETAEDFIEYSATKSKMSGKYYLVHCNTNDPVNSKDWLLTELADLRKSIKQD